MVSIFFSYRTRHDAQQSNEVEITMPESAEQATALLSYTHSTALMKELQARVEGLRRLRTN